MKTFLEKIKQLELEKESLEKYGDQISFEEIVEILRFVGTEESAEQIIDKFEDNFVQIYEAITKMAFSYSMKVNKSNYKKSRMCLRLLVNMVQRSTKFASKIPYEIMTLIGNLLNSQEFDKEILMLLAKTGKWSYLEFQKSPNYSDFLESVIDAFYRANREINGEINSDDASTALAYFSFLLENDYAILASSYAEMEPKTFCKLLLIVETILEHTQLEIHSNNLLFVINLLELICEDYCSFEEAQIRKFSKNVEHRKQIFIVELCKHLTNIIGEMCSRTEMKSKLNENTTAMNCMIDILDAILHSESLFAEYRKQMGPEWPREEEIETEVIINAIREEKRIEAAREKQSDRPQPPPPPKIKRVDESKSLLKLSYAFLEFYKEISVDYKLMGELKLNCIKNIGNLCNLSKQNKLATTKNGRIGLLSVLQCTNRRPMWFLESYAIQKWAIFCVRQLTDDCEENVEIILNLEQPSQPIVDREKLLKGFGLKVEYDEMKKQKLVRIEEESS